jgi:hypothetical protein
MDLLAVTRALRESWLGTGALLMACFSCVPLKDLSSYSSGSEGVVPEQPESAPAAPSDRPDDSVAQAADAALTPPSGGEMSAGELVDTAPDPMPVGTQPAEQPPTAVVPRAADAADPCSALGGFMIPDSGSCYMVGDNVFAWLDARSFCQAWGGDLVQIDSPQENAALVERIQGSVWIGANDLDEEGMFRWAQGNLLDFEAWNPGQPNNLDGDEDCADLNAFSGRWSDVPCSGDESRRALCERAASAPSVAND